MDIRLKRPLVILGFIAIVAVVAYGLYYFFFRVRPSQPTAPPVTGVPAGQLPTAGGAGALPTTTQPGAPGALPEAGIIPQIQPIPGTPASERTTLLRPEITSAASASPSGGVRSYNPLDGRFYKVNNDGTASAMSDTVFYNVDTVTWANKSDKAVLAYPDGSNVLYDFTSQKQTTLPKQWEAFSFAPQDDKIVAKSIGNSESNRFLVIANADGTDARAVEPLGQNGDKVIVSWAPNSQVVAFSATGDPIGFDQQSILLVGQNHENFKSLVVDGRGFLPNWSPTGQTLLYSVYNSSDGYRPTLWLSGATGDQVNANRRSISLQTWADKCAWQSDSVLYCAVPQGLGDGAGLQRSLFNNLPDSIYKVDLTTGQATNLGIPSGDPSVLQPSISADGGSLYFTDQKTGSLMRFAL